MIGFTLGRYFFFHYVKITLYFLLGIFSLSLLMDFTENAGRLANLSGYSSWGALGLSFLRIPFIMQQLFPFVALFSAMVVLMSLNRRLELVIARVAGLSAWQFLLPACLGAFLFGICAVVLVNPLAAMGAAKAESIIAEWRGEKQKTNTANAPVPWLTQKTDEGQTTLGAKMISEHGRLLHDVTFVRFNHDDTIADWLNADSARLEEGYWHLNKVNRYRAGGAPETIENLHIATKLRPEFVEERLADPATIPFYQLPEKIHIARSFGYAANKYDMQLQSLIALPALLVAMTLIAATVSIKFMRTGQSKMMILTGILAGFMLYVVTTLVQAFGNAGYVPPVVAAWVPVVIALFSGISFLLKKEDG